MKNQFYDTINCSTLEIVCFKQIESRLLTEERYAIYSVYMVVSVLPHVAQVKARWGCFTFSRIQLPALCVDMEGTICRDNDLDCSGRAHDLWLWFGLQFTQCRKEAAEKLAMPALKPWQNSFMHLELRHWRCHGQLSRSCVPNLSCNHFNQSCSSKGKITRALFCVMRQNRHYLTLSRTFKQHAGMLL